MSKVTATCKESGQKINVSSRLNGLDACIYVLNYFTDHEIMCNDVDYNYRSIPFRNGDIFTCDGIDFIVDSTWWVD